MSTSDTIRTSASPIVARVLTSASVRVSRDAAAVTGSRDDHDTRVRLPGSSVASTMVRPAAVVRLVINPGSSRTSDNSPGRSNVARALPAAGTGSTNDARPGAGVRTDPHSRLSENAAGPGKSAK